MFVRIIASIFLLFSVFLLPFWVTLLFGIVFLLVFPNYLEIIGIFFISDLLYGDPSRFPIISAAAMFTLAVISYSAIPFIRRLLRIETHA